MKIRVIALGVATCLLASLSEPIVEAQPADSPWPMFRHDARHTGQSDYAGPSTPGLLWSYQTGLPVLASPALAADGSIYASGYDSNFYALSSGGAFRWSYETYSRYSCPAVDIDGNIFVGSLKERVYCLTSQGKCGWSYATASGFISSPAIAGDGAVYIGSSEYDNNLYAFSGSGKLEWSYFSGEGWGINSSPAIGNDGGIFAGSDYGNVYAFSSAGKLGWSYLTKSCIGSSPAVGSAGEVYIGVDHHDNNLYVFTSAGTLKWSYLAEEGIHASPAVGTDGRIIITSMSSSFYYGNIVYALNSGGNLLWSYVTGFDSIMGSPSSAAIGSDGTMFIGADDDNLYAIDHGGALVWSYLTGRSSYYSSNLYSSPSIGSDGNIYFGAEDNNIYCISGRVPQRPTPTPVPLLYGVPVPAWPRAGDSFRFDVFCQPLAQRFDAYGVILDPGGDIYSFDLVNPTVLRKGVIALARNVPGLGAPFHGTLYSILIPPGIEGTFTFIVGLVPPGARPSAPNAIPGYLWEGSVTVSPRL